MGGQILHFLVDTVAVFFCIALLARFVLQAQRAPQHVWRAPFGQFVMAVTNWMVLPARRVIPAVAGYDTSSLLLAVLWQLFNMSVALLLGSFGLSLGASLALVLVLLAVIETVKVGLYLVTGMVLISAVFSWVNPHAPMADIINRLCAPWLRPFRRLIPPMGGVDLSPLALVVVLQVGLIVLAGLRNGTLSLLLM